MNPGYWHHHAAAGSLKQLAVVEGDVSSYSGQYKESLPSLQLIVPPDFRLVEYR